ncbi:MAG: glycosyltransferase [Propionibacteriaceae bacterium]|nr:glycosyltransferase [Propionibacteriaceae bacterium]
MNSLRIAQLANFIGPTSGGLRRAVDQIGRGYVAAGCARLLLVPGPHDSVTEGPEGVVVTIESPAAPGGYRLIAAPRKVWDVLERFQPTSVEVSDKWTLTVAAWWARRRGVGSVLFSHERLDDMASLFVRHDLTRPVHRLNNWLARLYDRVVVTTCYSAGEWDGTSARLVRVPLGVDLETFAPAAAPLAPEPTLRLVYAGRLSREKSPHMAVATAVELDRRGRQVRLDVYGTGPHVGELKAIANGSPVFFHGYSDGRAAVADAYRAADISLSVCPAETFGLAVLEALATGTPVVTADRGGARELVDASCAEWAPSDPVFLADAVERLAARRAADPAGLQAAARRRAETYPWSATVAQLLDLHADLAG